MDAIQRQKVSDAEVAIKIWACTIAFLDAGIIIYAGFNGAQEADGVFLLITFSFLFGLPALMLLLLTTNWLEWANIAASKKILLLHAILFCTALAYGLVALLLFDSWQNSISSIASITAAVYAASFAATLANRKAIRKFFGTHGIVQSNIHTSTIKNLNMHENPYEEKQVATPTFTNKILTKSIITAALILVMLIPSAFVESLITERQERQKEVVEEVSSKWALPQTVSAPYLVIPYTEGKKDPERKQLIVLPDQLDVNGDITEENRARSIYKVLLYKSKLNFSGNFHATLSLPDSATIIPGQTKLCFGLSDFRGIEEKITASVNNNSYTLLPGLPSFVIDSAGLSVPVAITQADIGKGIPFNMNIALRGSGNLHFLPLGANSSFNIQSAWPNPSFDGNTLPTERNVSGKGFAASWVFNTANMPFTPVIADDKNINTKSIEFGVSLVQPADQYVQSMRSAKYAILIIGLTFAVFFIFELLQKKPVHPVQYVLVGMALVVFYTLLVSISEIILFQYAYAIAAVATIILISLYAKSHFKTLRSAVIFGLLLSGLYGLIYVLISLEDTALLVGSIALFTVLAIIMYVTRKVNWYQSDMPRPVINVQP